MSPIEYINCSIQAGPGPREPECVICKVEIEQDEVSILHSSCRNAFHRDCIDSWVKASRETSSARQTTCPLCRNTETSIIAAPPVRDREVHRFLQTDLQGEIREAWETQENTKLQADFMIEGFRDLTELRQRVGTENLELNPYGRPIPTARFLDSVEPGRIPIIPRQLLHSSSLEAQRSGASSTFQTKWDHSLSLRPRTSTCNTTTTTALFV